MVANDTDLEGDTLSVTSVTTPSNGGAAIKSNRVTYTPNPGFTDSDSFDYTLSDGTLTDTGSVAISVAAAQAQPAQPTGLTASAGLSKVTLNWTDPFDSSINKYEYSQSVSVSDSNLVWTTISDSAYNGPNAASFRVTGLTNGTKYYFWIRATNSSGTSEASEAVDATSGNAAPTFDDGANTNLSVTENSGENATVGGPVTATDPEGDPLSYSLSGSDSFSIDDNGQITVAADANLDYEAESSYGIIVSVHDGKDVDGGVDTNTDATIEVTIALGDVAEVPARPSGLTANSGDAQVTLRWGNPSDNSITGHQYLSEQQVAKLTAGDAAANDYFGYSVAVDGDTAVVGAYGDDSSKGAAYVLVRQSGTWSQVAKLTASDGEGGDQFGRSVAVDGNTVVVGAYWDDDQGDGSGSVYVFTKPNTIGGWADWDPVNDTETAKLTASHGAANDKFGTSVAVDGDTVVVGAYWDDDQGGDSGSVYVFTKATDSVWADATETVKLTASHGAANDSFGISVALDGDTMAVGAVQDDNSGAAYVFTRQAGVWSQVAKLTAFAKAANDYFGRSVAVEENGDGDGDGDTVVVGASQDDDKGSNSGSAYVFTEPASGVWDDATETAKLTASDGAADDKFGTSVSMNGATVVVGATQDADMGSKPGAAYVFTKPGAGWATATETAKLTASDGAADDEFGISVAIDVGTVVVGAHKNNGSGSAYVYEVSGWTDIPESAPGRTNATSYTVTGLTNGSEYDFRVRAVNDYGESDATDAATVTPMVSAEPRPTRTRSESRYTPPNTAPIAVDDVRTTAAGTAVDIDVVANDTDLEKDTLRVVSVTTPSNGRAVINSGTTTVTYIPNPGFHGTDSFNYTLSDGFNTVTGTVTVTVTPLNRAPEAMASLAAVNLTAEGEALSVDVSGGFTDQDGDLLTYSAVSLDPAVATVAVMRSMVTITPVAAGSTTIEITASDPQGESATHSVPVTVRAAPAPTPTPEPTATPTPTPTLEPTPLPTPTVAPTAAPPTPVPTPVPPPATPTVAPAPTHAPPLAMLPTPPAESVTMAPPQTVDAGGGFPLWLIPAIAVALLVVGGLGIGAWRLKTTGPPSWLRR